ncbi:MULTISPECIES: exodeoxyribonuclease VII small subunit [Coprobacillaceae]|uniref:exodeoxyribonuclease VII small subunit n=1 Tax=Coprobacillaceae TaxID=2810280 RepID=UPI000E4FCE36|nr:MULTISPECIES: exodeoxyribonuclease VII small subunit [Coprobacillaceae]RHM63638.1 exodeoxyribonuclease VII small subunit [Coprobacillus sp. AF33-1AC]RHS96367.1 exodeoxyribonuclease VII small subunit [Erysipelatoclostridium sp. AM42-17]
MENNLSYEKAIKRLEEIIHLLENENTSLDQSVELFQEGIKLSKLCSDKLASVEDKVAKILVDGHLEDFNIEEQKNGNNA